MARVTDTFPAAGVLAGRPVDPGVVPAFYSATDTNLIYRWDGTAWATWASLTPPEAAVQEQIRDTIGAALVAGPNVTITPNDVADTITIGATLDSEGVRDAVGAALVAGPNVTLTVDDVADTITIGATLDSEGVRDTIGTTLVAGANITLTVDDVADTITVAAAGGAGAALPAADFVGSNTATGSGASIAAVQPAHAVGDLMLFWSDGETGVANVPAGWTDLHTGGSARAFWRLAPDVATAQTVTRTTDIWWAYSFTAWRGEGAQALTSLTSVAGTTTTEVPAGEAAKVIYLVEMSGNTQPVAVTGLTLRSQAYLNNANANVAVYEADVSGTTVPARTIPGAEEIVVVGLVPIEEPITVTQRTINAQTGAAYTLALPDAGDFVTMDNAAASTLTVPDNATVAFPVGTTIEGAQLGVGQVTITPAAGVTINAAPGLKVADRYATFGLLKIATNTWLAFGRLAA